MTDSTNSPAPVVPGFAPGSVTVTDGATVVSGRAATMMYAIIALRSKMSLELRTGMVWSNRGPSTIQQVQALTYPDGRVVTTRKTRKGAYADLDRYIVSLGGESKPLAAS